MIESSLMGKKRYLVDIDFRRQSVGDTGIVDWSGNVWTAKNGGGVVVNDSVLGNAMQFSGGWFEALIPTDLNLQNIPFLLEIVYRLTTGGVPFATGDTTGTKTAGLIVAAGVSTASAEVSVTAIDTNLGSFTMNTTGKWASNQRSKFTYTARPGGGEVLTLYHNDVVVSTDNFSNHWAGRGSATMTLGAQVKGTSSAMRGFIQSLRITKTA